MPARALRVLRSRRAAVWLLAGLTAYLCAVTAWPHAGEASKLASWSRVHPLASRVIDAAGLSRPYVHPVFLLAVVWLVLATAACAWERSRQAASALARPAEWRESLRRRAATASETLPPYLDHGRTASALAALGLRVDLDESGMVATSRSWAFLASPIFHWALTALFLLAALGPLTRAEGSIDVVRGESVIDRRGSYVRGLDAGPLFYERFSNASIGVESVDAKHVVAGVDRGASPLVVVRREGRTLARAYVYPNAPMRAGGLLIHRGAIGPAVRMRFEFPDGSKRTLAVPFDMRGGSAPTPIPVRLDLRVDGKGYPLSLVPAPSGRLMISSSAGDSAPIGPGASADLPSGVSATFVERTTYARLAVVNDWTVNWLYTAFVVAIVSAGFALFCPPRAVAIRTEPEGLAGIVVVASALDSGFRRRVRSALAQGSSAGDEE